MLNVRVGEGLIEARSRVFPFLRVPSVCIHSVGLCKGAILWVAVGNGLGWGCGSMPARV